MNESIMIVEDEVIVAMDMKRKLEKLGYSVPASVSSGDEAIKCAADFAPDLILMDINMNEGIDGIEASKAILNERDIPIVYITAYADDSTVSRAKETNPFGYIVKPFDAADLRSSIEISLRKFKAEKELKDRAHWLTSSLMNINDAIIITNSNNTIRFMNSKAESLIGKDTNACYGEAFSEVVEVVASSTDQPGDGRVMPIDTERLPIHMQNLTLVNTTDARLVPIELTGTAISDSYGESGIAFVLRDVSDFKRIESELKEKALYDQLTKLASRELLSEHLERALKLRYRRDDYYFALIFIDLDGFKQVNDTYGHDVGDQVLISASKRIRSSVRPTDVTSRFGGDEFVLLVDDMQEEDDALIVGDRLVEEIKQPFIAGDAKIELSASVGIVINGTEGSKAEELIRDADKAMYHAKLNGKGRLVVFTDAIA